MENLKEMLIRNGGEIVSSAECNVVEIALAKSCGRMHIDNDGFGFIYRPDKNKSYAQFISKMIAEVKL